MFSEKIKQLRTERKMTQADFAKEFSISTGTIAMWETNKRTPDIEMIKRIADYFNVYVSWLTDDTRFRTRQELFRCCDSWKIGGNEFFSPPYEFCGLLKKLREEQDVTTEEMAKEIGLTTEQYKECECGGDPISYEEAMKLCEYLGTTVKQVLFDHALYEPEYPVPPEWLNDIDGFEKMRQEAEDADRADYYAYASKIQNVSEPEDENLIILNRNAKKLSPENRKKLLDMAKLMFKEEFEDDGDS